MREHRQMRGQWIVCHALLAGLIGVILFAPERRARVQPATSLLMGICAAEGLALWLAFHRKEGKTKGTRTTENTGAADIMTMVWSLLFVWELATTVLDLAHPVLIPAPENVFDTFRTQWRVMLLNVSYSMRLLAAGFLTGMVLSVVCGLYAGWNPRLRAFAYPVANVIAPIPPVVLSPYLVALMPSFRSALVLVLFWPNFLGTMNRVAAVERPILDSARMMNLRPSVMIWRILLPYIFPGIVSGLKVSLTSSLLMLNFAELMGATHGMGYYVQNSITYANYTHAAAGILVIGAVVTVLNRLVSVAQRCLVR